MHWAYMLDLGTNKENDSHKQSPYNLVGLHLKQSDANLLLLGWTSYKYLNFIK